MALGMIFGIFFTQNPAHAEIIPSEQNPDFKSYQSYLDGAKSYCDSTDRYWGKNNAIRPVPQYPELKASAVNHQISRTQNLSNLSTEEKNRLASELDMSRIGDFSGFKTLEVARLQYRSTMNSLFSCAIVTSRLRILKGLRETVESTLNGANSEITTQLNKEQTRLEREKDNLQCNNSDANQTAVMQEIVNSATRQYCHYRYYLSYLDTTLESDRAYVESVEQAIGTGSGTNIARDSEAWIKSYNNYATALETEIRRADSTLPRAIRTFMDMEKAYPAHLLLAIIYDDYIHLRNNLSTYMNASTQTYLKAYNAQDANKR
mgnify:FL=1